MLQINRINEEKRAVMDQLEDAERQLRKRDDELARLRRENDMLRDEVGSDAHCVSIVVVLFASSSIVCMHLCVS